MEWLQEKIKIYYEKKAVIWQDRIYFYKDLYESYNKYYDLIKTQIPQGSVVSILSDYTFYSIALFLALVKNKNIIVPITNTVETEINERISESCSDFLINFKNDLIEVKNVLEFNKKHALINKLIAGKNSGLILFSSGSTGTPKAMIHNLDTLLDSFKDKKEKSLNFLIFLMFDHIGGLNTLFNSLSMGITITLPANRDAEHICSLIEKYKVDILPASPTFLNLIVISEAYQKYNLSSLKMITYGTEPMQESLLSRLRMIFPKVKFLQTFGTSETGIAQISSKSSASLFIKIEDANLEYKIINNELWLKSKTQILGYLNASMERFTEDGWFKTGDMVEQSDDGYLKIIGRNTEVINVGGQKVLPTEIESVLLQIPEIDDCIVYGEKNAITGQIVVADVVINAYNQSINYKKIIRLFCKDKLDNYKIPVKINFVDKTNFNDRFKKIRRK